MNEYLKLAECPRGQIETQVGTICWRMESADHVFLSAQDGGTVTINRVEYQISYGMSRVGGQWCKDRLAWLASLATNGR